MMSTLAPSGMKGGQGCVSMMISLSVCVMYVMSHYDFPTVHDIDAVAGIVYPSSEQVIIYFFTVLTIVVHGRSGDTGGYLRVFHKAETPFVGFFRVGLIP